MDPKLELIHKHIRNVPDFPKPGILFKDITPILSSPEAFKATLDLFAEHYKTLGITGIVAVESRGFIFGGPLAIALNIPLHIVRKPGKLPYKTDSITYDLEYGSDSLEIHKDCLNEKDKVVVLDDLLATGGTAAATAQLVQKQGAEVLECGFVIELGFLEGKKKIEPVPVFSLIQF